MLQLVQYFIIFNYGKIRVYAIVRFMIPIFPDIYIEFSTWFVAVGLFGLIYFGIAALMQDDIKECLHIHQLLI